MPKIEKITKLSENQYVNLYLVERKNKAESPLSY